MKSIHYILAIVWVIASYFFTPPAAALSQPEFGRVEVAPQFELDGAGRNIDSIGFWEAPDPANTLMFVSAKKNQLVEVWKYPFLNNEQKPLTHKSFGAGTRVNGVVVDQELDLLFVAVSRPATNR